MCRSVARGDGSVRNVTALSKHSPDAATAMTSAVRVSGGQGSTGHAHTRTTTSTWPPSLNVPARETGATPPRHPPLHNQPPPTLIVFKAALVRKSMQPRDGKRRAWERTRHRRALATQLQAGPHSRLCSTSTPRRLAVPPPAARTSAASAAFFSSSFSSVSVCTSLVTSAGAAPSRFMMRIFSP